MIRVLEPATEEVLAELPEAGAADIDAAVERARRVAPVWAATSPDDRARVLLRVGDALRSERDRIALIEARNAGKPLTVARGDVDEAAELFRYFAGAPERLTGLTVPVAGGVAMTFQEALGVVGVITAWNSPLLLMARKLAPALAGGNTVVHKPSELTPLSALEVERLVGAAGLPDGALTVVVGPGSTCGERLIAHPDVAKICFTGSTAVGRRIAAAAGERIAQVALELGGKSPNIIFDDADIAAAAEQATMAAFGGSGQDCCARSRIFVQETVLDAFLQELVPHVEALRVGDPLADETQIGPIISARQLDRVASFLEDDAPIVVRGSAPAAPGFWHPPVVLAPVDNRARAARAEIFGPIACVIPFSDEAHAVALANDSSYGLAASVWTADGARGLRVGRALEVGNVSVNSHLSVRISTPFGGVKQSGLGRELGPDALREFTQVKSLYYATPA